MRIEDEITKGVPGASHSELNRRALIGTTIAVGAALTTVATSESIAQVHNHGAPGKTAKTPVGKTPPASTAHAGHGPNAEIAATAKACVTKGDACLKHCIALLNKGDTSLVECMKTVTAMMPLCRALERYATIDAKHLKELVKLSLVVNTECETECRKHEAHHVTCKECADACDACIKSCNALI